MAIRVVNPRGMAPSVNPAVLGEGLSQWAVNCLLGKGSARPLRGTSVVDATTKVGTVQSIFPYGGKWFNWLEDVDVCRSPIAKDPWGRVYFTGGAAFKPQYTVNDIATAGADYPSASYDLGIPAPSVAPSVAVSGTPSDPDPTLVESRAYVETYVSAYGEEGPPGPPSALVDIAPGQQADLSSLPTAPAGPYNITQKRLYRTNTGSSGTDYQLVATYAVATTAFTDTVESADLGGVIPSADWDGPPADLHSLIMLPSGAFAGLSGNQLCLSEPYLPHAWPTKYRQSFDFDGVSLGAFGNNILVTTKGVPYLVTGSHPENMSPDRLEEGYACVSKRGMVDVGYALIYPAANGLMLAGLSGFRLLSEDLLDLKGWAALAPETVHAYQWDKKYVAFWSNATGTEGFIFDPAQGDLTYHTVAADAGYHDPLTGALYLAEGTDILSWDSGAELTAVWKSKKFRLPYPANHSCAKLWAEGPVTFKLWADGALKLTKVVNGPDVFRLPGGFLPRSYEFEVSGEAEWLLVALAQSMEELASL